MENPPDLIVAATSDDHYHDKKKVFVENIYQKAEDKQQEELLANLQSDKYALECELQQLRVQQAVHNNNEFNEQSYLLKQRFHDEIQSVLHRQTEFIQHAANDLTEHVTDVLRKSIHDIESLRLLHQKELCTYSNTMIDCIRHQSCEMSQLCHHLIDQQHANPTNLFNRLIDDFQIALNDLETSFDSKVNYLSDIHSSTIDKLNSKHETEINEINCELNLVSNCRT